MNKLLIYIGENVKFDVEHTKRAIAKIDGVHDSRSGSFIGATFECEYDFGGETTVVRMSEDGETVTVEGLGNEALDFALKLQALLSEPLRIIDLDYTFDLPLTDFESTTQLRAAMQG